MQQKECIFTLNNTTQPKADLCNCTREYTSIPSLTNREPSFSFQQAVIVVGVFNFFVGNFCFFFGLTCSCTSRYTALPNTMVFWLSQALLLACTVDRNSVSINQQDQQQHPGTCINKFRERRLTCPYLHMYKDPVTRYVQEGSNYHCTDHTQSTRTAFLRRRVTQRAL